MICRCCLETDKNDLLAGIIDVLNLEQLYKIVVDPTLRELHISVEFAEKYFTPVGLQEFINSVYGMNEYVQVVMDERYLARENELLRLIGTIRSAEDLVNLALNNRSVITQTILGMHKAVTTTYENELAYSNRLNSVNLQLMEQRTETESAKTDLYHLRNNYNELKVAYDILTARIRYQYNVQLDEGNWLEINADDNLYKRILYVKEITRVKYVDTFLYYLNETLMSLYNEPVRNIVIEPSGTYARSYMYPGYKKANELSLRDVVTENIFMAGFQSNLMKDILKNPERVNFLIILDRGCWHQCHVRGANVETIYTVSDLNDLNVEVSKNRLITYAPDTLYIPHLEGFEDLSSEQKIQRYSSLLTTKVILDLLELG